MNAIPPPWKVLFTEDFSSKEPNFENAALSEGGGGNRGTPKEPTGRIVPDGIVLKLRYGIKDVIQCKNAKVYHLTRPGEDTKDAHAIAVSKERTNLERKRV